MTLEDRIFSLYDEMAGFKPRPATPSKYYTTQELAAVMARSVKWVEKWRGSIAGAVKIGSRWSFDKQIINARLSKGLSIIIVR